MGITPETIAYAKKDGSNNAAYQTPWHGLGVPVTPDLAPADMLKVAGLDWTVSRHATYAKLTAPSGETFDAATGEHVLVRDSDNKILSPVSEKWNICQNHEGFSIFEEWCREGRMEMNTAGCLMAGKEDSHQPQMFVWALARIKDHDFDVTFPGAKGKTSVKDHLGGYMLFTLPHQYGWCIDVRYTNIRTVCWNTLQLALQSGDKDGVIKINHRKPFDPEQVKESLRACEARMAEFKEACTFLAKKKTELPQLMEFYRAVFPSTSAAKKNEGGMSKPANASLAALHTQPGADLGAGTWWAAFNSVTYMLDHQAGYSQNSRLASSWYGRGREQKIVALEKALEFAKAA